MSNQILLKKSHLLELQERERDLGLRPLIHSSILFLINTRVKENVNQLTDRQSGMVNLLSEENLTDNRL